MTKQLDRIEQLGKDILHRIETDVTNQTLIEAIRELGNVLPPPPIPEPPTPELPDFRIVMMLKKAPLREVRKWNLKEKMVMRIHGGLRNRIKAQYGEKLQVIGDRIKVDGSHNYAYRLRPLQIVNGSPLPKHSDSTARHPVTKETDKDFFVLSRHVSLI